MSEDELKFFPLKRQQLLAFRRLAAPRLQGRVADLGAGLGPYHREIPHCDIIALDREITPVTAIVASTLALPLKTCCMTGVVLTEVLEHVPTPLTALAEAARILKPDGWLYLTTPQMWPLHYEPYDYFRFTRYGLERLLQDAGFTIVEIEPLGGVYTYIFTRLGEKLIKLLVNLLGWLPRPRRWSVARLPGMPLQYLFYGLSRLLDPLAPRDVLGWAVVAKKDC